MRPGSSKLKDSMGGSSNRKRPYGILLLLAMGAAVLSVVLLNKMRERRVFGLLLQDRDQQLLALQLLLQKEQDHSKEIKRKLEDMKVKAFTLRAQKMELANKLAETQVTSSYLRRIQKEMETALQEKQNQINALMEKENLRVATLTGLLKEKEAKIEEMKHRQMNPNPPEHNNENTSRNDTSNGNVTEADKHEATTQNEPVEQLSNSRDGKDLSKDGQVEEANGIAERQEENKPREGQWVKFKTNTDDEGMADEDDNNADKDARDMDKEQQLMKIKDTQGSEPATEVSEISQGDIDSEAKDGESKGVQTKEERVLEDRDLERQEKPHYGNEQQAASTEPKRVVEGNDPKMRHRHRRRNKTKNRKQKIAITRGDEPERSNDGHSEDSGKNEGIKDENSEDEEGSALNKNLSEMPESSETIKKTAETGQKDDKNQKTVSGQIGLQNSVLSQDSDSTTTDKSLPRGEIEAKEEIIVSNNQKLQKSQNSDETENFREHEDDPSEIAKTEGTEVTSADGLSDKHDSSQGDEDKSIVSSNSGDTTVNLKKALNGVKHDGSVNSALHDEDDQEQRDSENQNSNDTAEF